MNALAKAALTIAVAGAVVAAVVLTKPGRARSTSATAVPAGVVDVAGVGTVRASAAPSTSARRALPTYRDPTSGSAEDAGADGGSQLQAWRDHGKRAVLRSASEGDGGLLAPVDRPFVAPRWDEPTILKFVDLKELYRGIRKEGDFAAETVGRLNGAAAIVAGAVMPIDPLDDSGALKRFWLANPVIVMAGCVFCNPPTMGDLVYVTAADPLAVDEEKLFRGIVVVKGLGRLHLGPGRSADGIEYLFSLELREALD